MFAERKQKTNWSICYIANKDTISAHTVFFIMQRVPQISHYMAMGDKGSIGRYIGDTWPFIKQWSLSERTVCCCKQKTKLLLVWTQPSMIRFLKWHLQSCSKHAAGVLQLQPYASSVWDPYLTMDINQLEAAAKTSCKIHHQGLPSSRITAATYSSGIHQCWKC